MVQSVPSVHEKNGKEAAASMYCGWKPQCQVINEHQSGFFDAQTEKTYFFFRGVELVVREQMHVVIFDFVICLVKNASHL